MARGKKKESALTPEEKLAQALIPVEEQPYQVPGNWCWIRQNSICSLSDGEKNINEFFPYWEVKALRGTKELQYVSAGKFVYQGSKVILVDGENSGEVFDIPADGYMGSTFKALQMSPIVHWDYLRFFISTKQELYRNNKKGSAIPHLNKELFFNMPLPLAPISEQQRIVERIEYLFAKLDEAKEKAQSALDSFETRKAAILHKAFTGELTAKWRAEHGVDQKSWRQLTLSQCASKIGDGLHGTPSFSDDGEFYFVNGNNFAGQCLEIKPDTKKVSVAEYEKHKIPLFKDVTVFVSINGTLGKTAFYNDEPVVLGKSACYVHVTDDLNKFFLRYYFETKEFVDYANAMATGSTIKNLGLKAMRNMPMLIPGMDEQVEIINILDSLFAKEQQAKNAAEAVLEKIDLLKKSILARAFRGELGTNDPNEDSAVELLKQVL